MRRHLFVFIAAGLIATSALAGSTVSPPRLAHDKRCYNYVSTARYYFENQGDHEYAAQALALKFLYLMEAGKQLNDQGEESYKADAYSDSLKIVAQFAGCRNSDIDEAEALIQQHQ